MSNNQINKQIAKGSIWMVSFKILEKSISIISTVILARLLSPEDFGLVAIALIIVTFLELLRSFNFDMALIQHQKATREHYDTAWTFNIIATALVAILLVIVAPLAADFYNDDRLLNIILVISAGIFISGFENIGTVAFRIELTFHKEFIFLLGKKIIGFIIGIGLAIIYKNYWALVGGTVATHIGVVLLSFTIHNYRPRFSLVKARELFSFSSWLLISNFLNFMNYKMPEAVIGKLSGTTSLGFFSVSLDISKLASTEIVLPINRAAFPGYSKLKNQYDLLRDSFLKTTGMITIFTYPAAFGLASISPVLVPVLLGDKWTGTILILQLLSIAGLISSLGNVQAIYFAIGKPKIMSVMFLIKFLITTPIFIYLLYKYGLSGGLVGLIISAFITSSITLIPLMKELQISISDLAKINFRPCVSSILAFIITTKFFSTYLLNIDMQYSFFSLLFLMTLYTIIYIVFTLLLWVITGKNNGAEKQILTTLHKTLFSR